MWTAEKFLEVLKEGRVITKADLRKIIIEIRESEYERGCEYMRIFYSSFFKRKKAAKEKKKELEFNKIVSEISDYVYKRKQESYYGTEGIDEFGKKIEPSKNGPPKRTRTLPK